MVICLTLHLKLNRILHRARLSDVTTGTGFLASLFVLSVANAAPPAISYGFVQAGRYSNENQNTIGPLNGPIQSTAANFEDSFTTAYGVTTISAESHIDVSLGPGVPVVGAVQGDAHVAVSGYGGGATATGGGSLRFYFEIANYRPSAFDPGPVPVYFEASGAGEINGYGQINASALLAGAHNFPPGFSFSYEGGSDSRSFSNAATFDLPPNTVGSSYMVLLAATATAYNYSVQGTQEESTAVVSVDPLIRFDQAAFNAKYGARAFNLDDYYALTFSPNVPVPEPETYALMLIGLSAVGFVAQQRRRCIEEMRGTLRGRKQ